MTPERQIVMATFPQASVASAGKELS